VAVKSIYYLILTIVSIKEGFVFGISLAKNKINFFTRFLHSAECRNVIDSCLAGGFFSYYPTIVG